MVVVGWVDLGINLAESVQQLAKIIKVNPTQVSEKRNHPVYGTLAAFEVLSKFKRNIAAVKSHDATE